MPNVLQEEYDRLFSDTNKASDERDALVSGELNDEANHKLAEIDEAQEKRFSRMEVVKKSIDNRKRTAKLAIEKGEANEGYKPEGEKETKQFQAEEEGRSFNADDVKDATNAWFTGRPSESRNYSITTSTQSNILLPSQVMPFIQPTVDHVLVRAGVARFTTPDTATRKFPVPTPGAGGKITQGASSYTQTDISLSESFTVACEPFGSGPQYIDNTTIYAPGYDVVNEFVKKALAPALINGQEVDDLNYLKALTSGNDLTLGGITSASMDYDHCMQWINALPAKWDAGNKAAVVSSSLYNALVGMTSSAGNRLVTYVNGQLFIGPVLVLKTGNSFDAFGATHVMGVLFATDAIMLREHTDTRVNTYTNDQRRDQQGYEMVRNHGIGAVASGISRLLTPAS